jgi:hypothetical protein
MTIRQVAFCPPQAENKPRRNSMPEAFWITLCAISALYILVLLMRLTRLRRRIQNSADLSRLLLDARPKRAPGSPKGFTQLDQDQDDPVTFANKWRSKWRGPA